MGVAVLLVTLTLEGPTAQGAMPLFEGGMAHDVSAARPDGPAVLRARLARVRFDRLAAALPVADALPSLSLNLFEDAILSATFERLETDAFGHQTWVGRVQGDARSTVVLSWKGGVLSGTIAAHDARYRVEAHDGIATIEQLDVTSFPVELPPLVPPAQDRIQLHPDQGVRPAAGEVVDVYVYYTTAAKNGAGGQAQIEALIAQGVAASNTAYARSGVSATQRLVGAGELTGYVQHPSDMSQDLNAFTSSSTVAATRNAVGADLMHLVVDATSNACGIAWLGPSASYAHGVTARGCFSGYTFTHEVGHNFGSHHAPEDGASGAWRTYAYGYKMCSGASPFRTVMAYACPGGGGTRILNLSNPTVPHNGLPTGTATQNNAQAHAEAFPIVQNFRSPANTAAPSAPQNLQAVVAGNQLTLSWQPPAQGVPIATYIVRAGTGPGLSNVYNGAVGAGTTVGSPIANGTYYIRVLAQNAAGVGPATADVVATVGVPPGPPQNAVASAAGALITLSWTPSAGGAVSTYIVQAGTAPGASNVFNGAVGTATSVSGTVGAGTYYLRVLAQGPGGTSAVSNEASVVVGPACTVPGAPVLSGSRSGNVITITWTTPTGGPVTGYTVRAGSGSGMSNLYNSGVGSTTTVSAAVGSGNYFIRVVADAACGSSAASNEVSVSVP